MIKRAYNICFLAIALLFFTHTAYAAGNTCLFRVGGTGSSCTQARTDSQSTAFSSVNAGIGCLAAGDTLLVHGGTYSDSISYFNLTIPSGTSWTNKIRIAAFPGSGTIETVWLKPPAGAENVIRLGGWNEHHIEFDGINMDGANISYDMVKIEWGGGHYAHHIRIQNAELKGTHIDRGADYWVQHIINVASDNLPATGSNEFLNLKVHGHGWESHDQGFYIGTPNNLIEGNDIYDISGGGIELFNTYQGITANSGNIISNNHIHHSFAGGPPIGQGIRGNRGINIAANNTQVYNNIIDHISGIGDYNNTKNAIWIYAGDNNQIYNNTLYSNGGQGIVVGYDYPVSGTVVRNNIIYLSAGSQGDYWEQNATNTTHDHNLEGTNPNFVNAATSKFQLNTGSQAIDAGINQGPAAKDITGVTRTGTYDIGAYEFGGTVTPPPQPPSPPSSSGTRFPPSSSITDSSGNIWTIDGGLRILRNGTVEAEDGHQLLYYQNNVYAFSYNLWWQWAGGGDWTNLGTSDPNPAPLVGDLNIPPDHIVNSLDWSIMNSKWYSNDANSDLNHDGVVNAIDFSLMNANWLKTW